jgi:hypothetical protein
MMTHQSKKANDNESSSDDESMTQGSPDNDDKNDDDSVNVEFNDLNEQEKENPQMDSGIIAESNDDDTQHSNRLNSSLHYHLILDFCSLRFMNT